MTVRLAAIAAATAASVLALASTAQAGHCVRVGGHGEAITKELAVANANDQLAMDLGGSGMKARGKVMTACKSDGIIFSCESRARACKHK